MVNINRHPRIGAGPPKSAERTMCFAKRKGVPPSGLVKEAEESWSPQSLPVGAATCACDPWAMTFSSLHLLGLRLVSGDSAPLWPCDSKP